MAKKIHWQIPFASAIDKKQYRVDIYQEGYTGNPVTLLAGSSPFNTEEDNNPDLFTPIRTQSGTLSIVTKLPDGTMLKAQDILPSNNTDCPVQLVELNDGEEEVVWQGFLSCEAYSQDYIGIAQELSLSLISVLEAMDSVEINMAELSGVQTIGAILGHLVQKINEHAVAPFTLYVGGIGQHILTRYADTALFYEKEERDTENGTEIIMQGVAVKEALSKIATYMGWCVREQGTAIYMQTAGIDASVVSLDNIAITTEMRNIADLEWRGTGHTISSRQGAKSVSVVADLRPSEAEIDIPQFPRGEYLVGKNAVKHTEGEITTDVEVPTYASTDQSLDGCYIKNWLFQYDPDILYQYTMTQEGTMRDVWDNSAIKDGTRYYDLNETVPPPTHLGAFMVRAFNSAIDFNLTGLCMVSRWWYEFQLRDQSYNIPAEDYAIRLVSKEWLSARSGRLRMKLGARNISNIIPDSDMSSSESNPLRFAVGIRWGNKFLQHDLETWGTSFNAPLQVGEELDIEISEYNSGAISLYIYPIAPSTQWTVLFTEASLTYEDTGIDLYDREANRYFEAIKVNFRDEVEISTEFASDLNNPPSSSILLNSNPANGYNPLVYLPFMLQEEKRIRPEEHLLGRMVNHYKQPRTMLKLEVATPDTPLALLRLNGINDGKMYLPLAASIDWQRDICQLHCYETAGMYQGEDMESGGSGDIQGVFMLYDASGQLWDNASDYIRLVNVGDISTVYITSDYGVDWVDEDGLLGGVFIGTGDNTEDYENQSGYIPAGTMVPMHFMLGEGQEPIQGAYIYLYSNGTLRAKIEVVTF